LYNLDTDWLQIANRENHFLAMITNGNNNDNGEKRLATAVSGNAVLETAIIRRKNMRTMNSCSYIR